MEYQRLREIVFSVLEYRIVKKLYTFTGFGKLDVLKNVEETIGYKITICLLEGVKFSDDFTGILRFRRINRSIYHLVVETVGK